MSVATELVSPSFELEPQAFAPPSRERVASVTVLHAPTEALSPPLRLTRRGVVAVAVAVALLGVALVWLARISAPSSSTPARDAATVVVVQPGDTLWQIAGRVAPGVDPREEVARLQRRNGLRGVDLVPGQQLRVP